MIKVAALTSGQIIPSTRFRIRQHIESLKSFGVEVNEFVPAISRFAPIPGWPRGVSQVYGLPLYALWQWTKLAAQIPGLLGSWDNQITWLEGSILPRYLTFEPLLKKPLVFDVDDAIWLRRPFGSSSVRAIAKIVDVVIAGNSYLAEWFADYARDVRIVPTAVNTEYFYPRLATQKNNSDQFVIGWTGSSSNLPYLEAIETPLKWFFEQFPNSEILVVSNQPPAFHCLPSERVRYIPWSAECEAEAVRQMDVGLMPLPDTNWSRGKCSFKMLQYMASGIPVVVSPIGMNVEILAMSKLGLGASSDSDWYEALLLLYQNQSLYEEYGQNGRNIVEEHFSHTVVAKKLAEIFLSLEV